MKKEILQINPTYFEAFCTIYWVFNHSAFHIMYEVTQVFLFY